MKRKWFTRCAGVIACLCLLSTNGIFAQSEADSEENIFLLSPFEVSTENDKGYYASNTISGSRIDIELQNMPMPIEVITSEFIEDTGATDLRQSLRFSAGVILNSQNDAGANLDGVVGGVHNGAGATANLTGTTIKIRGFVTESTLRKGFRRQHGSDSINIDRVEVVRGPAALLYGIGNFGGIVNYLPKRPLDIERTEIAALIGSDNQYRATIDTTAPVNDQFSYRVTGAWEQADHWTDHQSKDKWFLSPVLEYKPFERTKITLDFEIGNEKTNGVGFQTMRARGDLSIDQVVGGDQQDRLSKAGFVVFDGVDNRTARISGPDTFVETDATNLLIEVEQNITSGLNLLVGYNRSDVDVATRDIVNNLFSVGEGPSNLRSTIFVEPFEAANGDPIYDGEIFNPNIDGDNTVLNDAILAYQWETKDIIQERDEVKIELNYLVNLFQDSTMLRSNHTFLLGMSDLRGYRSEEVFVSGAAARSAQLYRDPNDLTPIRFGEGIQDNGTPDGFAGFSPLLQTERDQNIAYNQGYYAVWQGRFWNDRITAIYGMRRDRNDQRITEFTFEDGSLTKEELRDSTPQSETTRQWGINVEILEGVSIFAMQSEGLEPNFAGLRDGNGNAISATFAESEEAGIKLTLFDGRVAASASAYKIEVTGASTLPAWWTPAPAKERYDPTQPTVYDINNIIQTNSAHAALGDLYANAVAAGNVFEQDGITYLTVLDANGNDTAGAAYLDAVFAWTAAGNGWPGWLYAANDFSDTPGNNAAMDWGAGSAGTFDANLVSGQESTGYELQFMFTLTDNWQLVMNYANTERKITDQGKFPQYPYPQDRWAIWYFPDGNWGLQGVPLNEAYVDPQDTSTWTGGPASTNGLSLDDTPEHDFGFWSSYSFDEGPLEGLRLAFGGDYQSERAYLTGFTVGGNAVRDADGNRINLFTDEKWLFNCMVAYDTQIKENPISFQLNIDNLTDDKDLYGYVYESGLSWRFQTTFEF